MSRHQAAIRWLVFVCAAGFIPLATAAPAEPEYVDGVLLLRNDSLVSGHIQRSGDWYIVQQASAQLRIPALQVERFCQSGEEAYEVKRRELPTATSEAAAFDAHAELAYWCLRHDMPRQARQEFAAAQSLSQFHPLLRRLDAQISQAEAAQARRGALHLATPSPESPAGSSPTRAAGVPDGHIHLAVHDVTEVASPPSPPTSVAPPLAARVQFLRQIQPMLVHSCSTSGCHQPDSGRQFQLDRLALAGSGHVDLTARNLSHALAQTHREQWETSPILQYAGASHGAAQTRPSQPLNRRQIEILREWLQTALEIAPPESPAPESTGVEPATFETSVEHAGSAADDANASWDETGDLDEASFDDGLFDKGLQSQSLRGGALRVGIELRPVEQPRDEFDPEIFNRLQSTRKP
ncbi:MAG: hypothetical protein KDA61_13860 [Planctomycetales bacterium]|nr:hypothetical protein [Planctomycetales bacterium]